MPIYRTRWEHRVLYNNTNHTHTHTNEASEEAISALIVLEESPVSADVGEGGIISFSVCLHTYTHTHTHTHTTHTHTHNTHTLCLSKFVWVPVHSYRKACVRLSM